MEYNLEDLKGQLKQAFLEMRTIVTTAKGASDKMAADRANLKDTYLEGSKKETLQFVQSIYGQIPEKFKRELSKNLARGHKKITNVYKHETGVAQTLRDLHLFMIGNLDDDVKNIKTLTDYNEFIPKLETLVQFMSESYYMEASKISLEFPIIDLKKS